MARMAAITTTSSVTAAAIMVAAIIMVVTIMAVITIRTEPAARPSGRADRGDRRRETRRDAICTGYVQDMYGLCRAFWGPQPAKIASIRAASSASPQGGLTTNIPDPIMPCPGLAGANPT